MTTPSSDLAIHAVLRFAAATWAVVGMFGIPSLVGLGCQSCHDAPPPVSPVSAQAVVVYQELIAGGYMDPDEGGSAAVQELFDSDVCPPWLACMMDGGVPTTCGVDKLHVGPTKE